MSKINMPFITVGAATFPISAVVSYEEIVNVSIGEQPVGGKREVILRAFIRMRLINNAEHDACMNELVKPLNGNEAAIKQALSAELVSLLTRGMNKEWVCYEKSSPKPLVYKF